MNVEEDPTNPEMMLMHLACFQTMPDFHAQFAVQVGAGQQELWVYIMNLLSSKSVPCCCLIADRTVYYLPISHCPYSLQIKV